MDSYTKDNFKNLKIGITDKKKDIYISYENRFLNTLVIGNKGTGKTSLFYKNFANQIINDKNTGGTFVTSSRNTAYEIHLLAKNKKRRISFLNPTVSYEIEKLMKKTSIKKSDIKELIDFERLIFNNYIVIIDLEPMIYGEKSFVITSLILECLKESMYQIDKTCLVPHFLQIEDSYKYLSSIEDILYYGNQYNVGTTLFFQNRTQFKNKGIDFSHIIDSNVCNLILMNDINLEDSKYYSELVDINLTVSNKSRGKFFYRIKSKEGAYLYGHGEAKEDEDIKDSLLMLHESKKALNRRKKAYIKRLTKKEDSEEPVDVKTNIPNNTEKNISDKLTNNILDTNEIKDDILEDINVTNGETLIEDGKLDLDIYNWDDEF